MSGQFGNQARLADAAIAVTEDDRTFTARGLNPPQFEHRELAISPDKSGTDVLRLDWRMH